MKQTNDYSDRSDGKYEDLVRKLARIGSVCMLLNIWTAIGFSQSMEWLSHPRDYEEVVYAGKDIFRVKNKQGKWGLMNPDGKLILDVVYDSITPFNEERSLLLDRPSKRLLGIIDTNGEFVKDFSGENIYYSRFPQYREGRLAFSTGDGLCGYLNEGGGVAIQPKFYLAGPYQDGVAAVQYDNTEYGLIRKDGRSAIVSDDRFYFMSTPVEGKVLAIKGSRKGGDQLLLMRVDGANLKKEKVLEDGMNITLADDFKSLECQLGHVYYIDDQWRVTSASYPAPLPHAWMETTDVYDGVSSELTGLPTDNGYRISYKNRPIVNNEFKKVSGYDDKYAVVKTKDGKTGVLKLNPAADISVSAISDPVVFYHNEEKVVELPIGLKNLDPSKLKIQKLDGTVSKECVLQQMDGEWKLHIPYFMAAEKYDEIQTGIVGLVAEYDGLDWKAIISEIQSKHQPGYTVTLTGSGITNENGTSVLTLHVKAVNGKNANGSVIINGGKPIALTKGSKSIPLTVSVPEGGSKTFTYKVKVTEEGCPDYMATVSKSVSNTAKKTSEPKDSGKDNGKKKIIIQ